MKRNLFTKNEIILCTYIARFGRSKFDENSISKLKGRSLTLLPEIIEKLDELKRIAYLKQIKADLQIDIEGISLNEISDLIMNELKKLKK